jgi:hypothetical protein
MRPFERSLALTLALLASACSREAQPARYTVEEYRANAELRHAQVARCQRDPGSLKKTPDCINAQAAAAFEDRLRLRDTPPVGLDPKRNPSDRRLQDEEQDSGEPPTPPPGEAR